MLNHWLLLDTGFCRVSAHHVMRGAPHQPMDCHALVALLHHPQHGWILWDSGYAPRMLTSTQRLPYRLYRLATPLHIRPAQSVIAQLPALGIDPQAIRTIIISHFHADHLAGLHDFAHARFIASAPAYAHVQSRRGLAALRRGFIPALLPPDFAERVRLLTPADFRGPPLPALGATCDLFGDGVLQAVWLPGHARGQIGLLARTSTGDILLAADGCWTTEAYRELRPPHRLTHLFVDDPVAVGQTLHALHHFAHVRPAVRIIPTHCPAMLAYVTRPAAPISAP